MAVDQRNLGELRDALSGDADALAVLAAFDLNPADDRDAGEVIHAVVDQWAKPSDEGQGDTVQ